MNKSISRNYFYNLIKTLSSMLFPILTFTYSTRVLGVEGVGKINFTKSFITYFVLLATLGITYYGTREAAKLRDDRLKLSKFAREMLTINSVTTAISYFSFFLLLFSFPKLQEYKILLLINGLSIGMQGLGMEWLYQGLEEYRYISVRSVVCQMLALGLMYLFVKNEKDIYRYAFILVFASSGSYVLNFFNARKYIDFQKGSLCDIKIHLKPIMWLFAMEVSIELYTVLDTTMLGFIQGDFAVGKYSAAIKINKLVNRLITSLGIVIMPRLSYYIGRCQYEQLKELVYKAYNFVFLLSVPACLGVHSLSEEIILLFGGKEFMSASLTMNILTPIILVIPFSVVTNNQIFIPMKKEKTILLSTCAGAISNFGLNLFLIPRYAENGAAIATVIAETVVAIICFFNVRKYFSMRTVFQRYYQYWIAALPILFISYIIKQLKNYYLINMVLIILLSGVSYFLILMLFRNIYLIEVVKTFYNKYIKSY